MRGRYGRLLSGGVFLLVGFGLIIYTFTSPIASTAVACPGHMTQWELFGISLPIVRSIEIAPMEMQLSWYDGCNTNITSLWIPLGGISSFLLGSVLTVGVLRKRWL